MVQIFRQRTGGSQSKLLAVDRGRTKYLAAPRSKWPRKLLAKRLPSPYAIFKGQPQVLLPSAMPFVREFEHQKKQTYKLLNSATLR